MKENEPVLKEKWHTAETIRDDGTYEKLKWRSVQQLSFYIRPAKEWFVPCHDCQNKLRTLLADAEWILGNKNYEPAIEMNSVKDELDESSWETLEKHKATPEELKRIGKDGWEEE
jgi:hypothetical protein